MARRRRGEANPWQRGPRWSLKEGGQGLRGSRSRQDRASRTMHREFAKETNKSKSTQVDL